MNPRSYRRVLLSLALIFSLAGSVLTEAAIPSSTQDWPQFRGPGRDGISPETSLLTRWPEEGPRVLWRARGGQGYSGLVVSDGRLYTLVGEGEKEKGTEHVLCLEASTGKELWRFPLGSLYVDSSGNGDGPRATPIVDDARVYVMSGVGRLFALDKKTGKAVWQHDLKGEMGSAGASDGSFSSSPLIEGDLLIVEAGGETKKPGDGVQTAKIANPVSAAYAAFDRKTGAVRWTAENDGAAFSAPVAITAAGARQIVFFSATGLVSVSPKDGKVFWRYPWKTQFDVNAATPLLLPGDRLFVSSGYDVGAAVLQLKPEAGGGVKVEEVWKSRVMKNHFATSIHLSGHLYGFDKSTFKCVESGTGTEKWAGRGYGTGNVIYADGHLIVLSDRGELALIEATPAEFREVAKAKVLEGRTITSPALADGKLYVRNNTDEIVCLDVAERKEKS